MASSRVTQQSVVCQHPEQVAAEVDDEVLMMNVTSGNYYSLNEVASFVWRQLAVPMSVGSICAAVQREFDVAPETCASDMQRFLEGMVKEGMLLIMEDEPVAHDQVV